MRISSFLPTAAALCVAVSSIQAQDSRGTWVGPGQITGPNGRSVFDAGLPRAVVGIGTTSGSTSRDTLGVLVSTVRAGSPAEKAGIEEGNRIASVNGVSLRLSPADIGDDQMAGVLSRRLNRELDKLKPGDEVDLRVYVGGQTKSLKIKTVASEDLYAYSGNPSRRDDERATLGINISTTGTSRDTLGIFVMSVEDGGPAAKAGIEEGTRIASINGTDVRGKDTRNEDEYFFGRPSNLSRLEREMAKVKPGDDVDLRVFYNGQYRNVKVKAGRLSDLPRRNRSVTITRGDNLVMPGIRMRVDPMEIGSEVRRAIEGSRLLEGGRVFGRFGNRIDW